MVVNLVVCFATGSRGVQFERVKKICDGSLLKSDVVILFLIVSLREPLF